MLASKGTPYFRTRFLEFLIDELRIDVNVTKGKNNGLSKDVLYFNLSDQLM